MNVYESKAYLRVSTCFARENMKYYVYMLRCRTGHLYTGYTSNIKRRLAEHDGGIASKFTRCRRPLSLVYQETCESRAEAIQKELEIKKLPRARKLSMCNSTV